MSQELRDDNTPVEPSASTEVIPYPWSTRSMGDKRIPMDEELTHKGVERKRS